MPRTIPIHPKSTSANTQYWSMSDQDRAWLLGHLVDFLCEASEMATHDEDLRRDLFRRRPSIYPRGQRGPNSHVSMLAGITQQLFSGRDLTSPQLDACESIMRLISQFHDASTGCEPIQWDRGWAHE